MAPTLLTAHKYGIEHINLPVVIRKSNMNTGARLTDGLDLTILHLSDIISERTRGIDNTTGTNSELLARQKVLHSSPVDNEFGLTTGILLFGVVSRTFEEFYNLHVVGNSGAVTTSREGNIKTHSSVIMLT